MKKFSLVTIVLAVFIMAWCTTSVQENNTDVPKEEKITTVSYENKQNKLKLKFPSSRNFKENVYGATVMFFAPKVAETTENLWITIKLIASGANLETLYQENKEILKEIAWEITVEEEKAIKIDNYPAKQIIYSFVQENRSIKQEQILVIKGENVYIINYTATKETFATHKKDVDSIIKSISIR